MQMEDALLTSNVFLREPGNSLLTGKWKNTNSAFFGGGVMKEAFIPYQNLKNGSKFMEGFLQKAGELEK